MPMLAHVLKDVLVQSRRFQQMQSPIQDWFPLEFASSNAGCAALSRRKQGVDSPRERHSSTKRLILLETLVQQGVRLSRLLRFCATGRLVDAANVASHQA